MLDKKAIKKKLSEFWERHETRAVLIVGFLIVSIISFEFGLLQGQKWQQKPLIIEKSALAQDLLPESVSISTSVAQKTASEAKNSPNSASIPVGDCVFMGSKNSNKYHSPNCRWVKSIKPENMICFTSGENATSKGYLPDKNCIK